MKNMEPMDTPSTRAEFEQRFHKLAEQIRRGKYHDMVGGRGGLEQVRLLPNGRIDILSIDERARLQANTMAHFDSERMQELMKGMDIGKPLEQ